MSTDRMIILAHSWLEDAKINHRLTLQGIGDILDYTKGGVQKAMKNKTFNIRQIEKIAETLNLETELSEFLNRNVENVENKKAPKLGADITIKDAIRMIINYEKEAEKDPDYKLFLKTIKQQGVIEFLESKQ